MKRKHWFLFSLAVTSAWVGMAWGQDAAVKSGVTPESVRAFFDSNKMMLTFVIGLLIKYIPGAAMVPNAVIPWVGTIAGIIMDTFAPPAHAGWGSVLGGTGSLLLSNFFPSVLARQLYEAFARPVLEKLGAKKAV